MPLSKIFAIGSFIILGLLALFVLFKPFDKRGATNAELVQEIKIDQKTSLPGLKTEEAAKIDAVVINKHGEVKHRQTVPDLKKELLPEANRIEKLFATEGERLPFVETLTYSSRVPWLKDRAAWIADYASYYQTTRHFIARSLNKKIDYFTQEISLGDKFNVLSKDVNVNFYVLIDISRSKLWFYFYNPEKNERILLKTYRVGLGRKDSASSSGSLTPLGKFTLGSKVAIYKPGSFGYFQDKKTEMIRIFGTRWIPFEKRIDDDCLVKGYGIHGAPWKMDEFGNLVEERSKVGMYDSDGCIRLYAEDIEELFSIIISRPTIVEIVKDFHDAQLPGQEIESW